MSPGSRADLSADHRAPGFDLERDGGGRISLAGLKDSVARHDKFKAKHDLGVVLASDPEGTLCQDYGVWLQMSMYGRKYMGIGRATHLIVGDRVIRRVWRQVKVADPVDQVLAAARAL